MGATRIESDSMGPVAVPAGARWGAQTQRAVENFPVSGQRVDPALIQALARIKGAAAAVNATLGVIPADVAGAIGSAAGEVAEGEWNDQFPVDVFQTGSGTSTNMNVNEVLASLASERLGSPVHPNDHVNASQSSNDTFPTALHMAVVGVAAAELLPALDHLGAVLRSRAADLAGVVKAGRTHLMDAVPVTLGQELGGYATSMQGAYARVAGCLPDLCDLALGGTAVGTGLNAPRGFAPAVIARLSEATGLPFQEAPDHFEAQGGRDAVVAFSGALRGLAVALVKVANDLRWMGSGPAAGLAEIHLPDLQPGSSIMPGKVNPVVPESVIQVASQVVGNDAAVAFAASTGTFELNVAMPVIARNVLESTRILGAACRLLADRCVSGLVADAVRCRRLAESSPAIATALAPLLGYDAVAAIVKEAVATGRTIREVAVSGGGVTEADLDRLLDVGTMARGGFPG